MNKRLTLLAFAGLLSVFLFAQSERNYTVIVSLDGFRWDYAEMYETPHLDRIARQGVKATMLPSYPASTFPNHYTLATGLVPDHHGIVNNSFWDPATQMRYSMGDSITRNNPDYYLGEPIWITAQKQGVSTGITYWVGSDIQIKGMYPDSYLFYDNNNLLSYEERIDRTLAFLEKPEAERPGLIMMYMEEPDGVGHREGPVSKGTGEVVQYLDSLVGILKDRIDALPIASRVNLIITSDHGMAEISPDRVVDMNLLNPEWCEVVDGQAPTSVFSKPGFRDSIYNALKDVAHIQVWKKEEIPAELCYGTSERIGDIVIVPDTGWQFTDRVRTSKGAHGYSPQSPEMQVIFRACGPDFKDGYESKGFVNVDIYPLLAYLLRITPEETDGRFERVEDLLK